MTQDELREIRKNINQLVRKSMPMNRIHLTHEQNLEIIGIWNPNVKKEILGSDRKIPDDLLIMDTIPVPDCSFVFDDKNNDDIYGLASKFRVCIFDKDDRILVKENNREYFIVGTVEFNMIPNEEKFGRGSSPIVILPGSNHILTINDLITISDINGKMRLIDDITPSKLNKFRANMYAKDCLDTWYGAQICMLYPSIRVIFGTPEVIAEQNVHKTFGKARKRPLCHVKVFRVNDNALKALKNSDKIEGKKEWKTKVWYVAGHFRYLKDGRKIWVKPYLKGPLRNELTPDERDRAISTKGAFLNSSLLNDKLIKAQEKASKTNKIHPSRENSKSVNRKKPSIDD